MEEHLIQMTNHIIHELLYGNVVETAALFHQDIIFESGGQGEFIRTKKRVKMALRHMITQGTYVSKCQCQLVAEGRDKVVITGNYIQSVKVEKRGILRRRQHIFIVWRKDADVWSIGYLYMPVFSSKGAERSLLVSDGEGTDYLISEKNICYIEAMGKHSIIHCIHKELEAKEGISKIEEKLGSGFVRIHRSFVVNKGAVAGVKRFWVILDNGTEIPIPAAKYTEVKSILMTK